MLAKWLPFVPYWAIISIYFAWTGEAIQPTPGDFIWHCSEVALLCTIESK